MIRLPQRGYKKRQKAQRPSGAAIERRSHGAAQPPSGAAMEPRSHRAAQSPNWWKSRVAVSPGIAFRCARVPASSGAALHHRFVGLKQSLY
jgi:hypothetical protein